MKRKKYISLSILYIIISNIVYWSSCVFPSDGVTERKPESQWYPCHYNDLPEEKKWRLNYISYPNGLNEIIVGNAQGNTLWCGTDPNDSKEYNLIEDLWLPKLYDFEVVSNRWFLDDGKVYYLNDAQRDWNYSIYKQTNPLWYYNLYNSNGQKWWICNPYYIVWINRALNKQEGYYPKYLWYKDATSNNFHPTACDGDTALWFLFYFPFPIDDSWNITNNLNIITTVWHLNWKLNPEEAQLSFTFY